MSINTIHTELVSIKEYIPDILLDIKYTTKDNFTGKVIYDDCYALLRLGTIKKLQNAQCEFKSLGYSLKIWDAFRPISAQSMLWMAYPDDKFVTNPKKRCPPHNKGNTVDVTLVDLNNMSELIMPTAFDEFTDKTVRLYTDLPKEIKENVMLLENVMVNNGFVPNPNEWWEFADCDQYPGIG